MLPADLEAAIRASWSEASCDPVDLPWTTGNPSCGQCGVTSLVVQDHVGGDLLMATVRHADGRRQGVHYWNRLPDGTEVDLTREQFRGGEVIQDDAVVQRRPDELSDARAYRQYVVLRDRVAAALSPA
jgi:hypothetical protein